MCKTIGYKSLEEVEFNYKLRSKRNYVKTTHLNELAHVVFKRLMLCIKSLSYLDSIVYI